MQIKAGLEWVVVNRAQWDRRAALNERVETIFRKLAEKRNCPPEFLEVKWLIGEYGFVMKQITQVQDETGMMQYLA